MFLLLLMLSSESTSTKPSPHPMNELVSLHSLSGGSFDFHKFGKNLNNNFCKTQGDCLPDMLYGDGTDHAVLGFCSLLPPRHARGLCWPLLGDLTNVAGVIVPQ